MNLAKLKAIQTQAALDQHNKQLDSFLEILFRNNTLERTGRLLSRENLEEFREEVARERGFAVLVRSLAQCKLMELVQRDLEVFAEEEADGTTPTE